MKFRDLLQDRDLTIEAQLLNTLPASLPLANREQIRSQIHQAIERAARLWEDKYLPILLGGEGPARDTLQARVPPD